MDSHHFFDFLIPEESLHIKEEVPEQTFSLISPPITPPSPSFTLPGLSSTTSRRRGSSSSLVVRNKRPKPYSFDCRVLGDKMSGSGYGTWSASTRSGQGRSHPSAERRGSGNENQPSYTLPQQFLNEAYLDASSDIRSISASSSLTGAMGDANISSQSRQSGSPASSHSGHIYSDNVHNHDLGAWNPSHMQSSMTIPMSSGVYPGVGEHSGMSFPAMGSNLELPPMPTRNTSPDSLAPGSPQYSPSYEAYTVQGSGRRSQRGEGSSSMNFGGPHMPSYHASVVMSSSTGDRKDEEVKRLRRRVQELEREVNHTKSAMETMRNSVSSSSGLPTPPHSAAFHSSWRARTEARKRIYCSLNRAGNALCAWHDSRRERRAYPPRNAPPGYLNCGCTYEEALFEESLSRHGVGSYLPGETVRMDPALRNPLLKLLQDRYGYKDGDFEHDPITETWAEGESPLAWEKKAQSGGVVKRRSESERH